VVLTGARKCSARHRRVVAARISSQACGESAELRRGYFPSNSLIASARCVSPSASCFVVGFSVSLATCLDLLPADTAHCAALLMDGDRIGRHRQGIQIIVTVSR
jgi:hypothetical protein